MDDKDKNPEVETTSTTPDTSANEATEPQAGAETAPEVEKADEASSEAAA